MLAIYALRWCRISYLDSKVYFIVETDAASVARSPLDPARRLSNWKFIPHSLNSLMFNHREHAMSNTHIAVKKLGFLAFFVVALTCFASLSSGQESSNSKPALWKWASDSNSKKSSMFNGPDLNWPKMPTFQGVRSSTSRAFNSAKQTTGRMWHSTVDFLNPFDDGPSKSSSSVTTSNGPTSTGGAWFFQKKEEKPQYSTVNEFLRQERPKF